MGLIILLPPKIIVVVGATELVMAEEKVIIVENTGVNKDTLLFISLKPIIIMFMSLGQVYITLIN